MRVQHVILERSPISEWVSSHTIMSAAGSILLCQFPHRPVNGQRGLQIRLLFFPFDGLNHSQPPHAFYTELPAPIATKC
jgi:hypothetical protein